MAIGDKIKEIRRNKGFSQDELAAGLQPFLPTYRMSKGHISNWERNVNPPNQEVIDALVKVLRVSEAELRGLNMSVNITPVSTELKRRSEERLMGVIQYLEDKVKDLETQLEECRRKTVK